MGKGKGVAVEGVSGGEVRRGRDIMSLMSVIQ